MFLFCLVQSTLMRSSAVKFCADQLRRTHVAEHAPNTADRSWGAAPGSRLTMDWLVTRLVCSRHFNVAAWRKSVVAILSRSDDRGEVPRNRQLGHSNCIPSLNGTTGAAAGTGALACIHHLLLRARPSRPWLGYVERSANISDGLSRVGAA